MKHLPECIAPDEVGARGSCACPEPVEATWWISLDADCPACSENVDLLDAADFWDGRNLNIGEHGTARTEAVEVRCPNCDHEFEVKTVY